MPSLTGNRPWEADAGIESCAIAIKTSSFQILTLSKAGVRVECRRPRRRSASIFPAATIRELRQFLGASAARGKPRSWALKHAPRSDDREAVEHRGFAFALGAGQLFWVSVLGLMLFLGSAIENGPYRGESAEAAVLVGRGLLISAGLFYTAFHVGFVLLARRRRLPLLAWSSVGVALAPAMVGPVPFPALSILAVLFGGSLLAARKTLGDGALAAGILECGGGLLGLLFGPTPYALLFVPAWVFKSRLLRATQRCDSPHPSAGGAHVPNSQLAPSLKLQGSTERQS